MPPFLIPALAFAKRLKLGQIALIALAALLAVQTVRVGMEQRHSRKLSHRVNELRAEMDRISSAKDEQGKVTTANIGKANERIVYVERKARQIEAAPLPGNCKTPGEIMGADL